MSLAAVLRLVHFSDWSLSNDELSALSRLNFDSISAFFQQGIAEDGHPAFTQVFLFLWTSLFGTSSFAIRLPFVMAGIFACYYFYLFLKDFVHEKAAEISLALLVCSQFFIQYSQLARPYAVGLFFVMGTAYYAYRLLRFPEQRKYLFFLILFAWLGVLSHYFASLSIAVFLALMLLFLNKENWKSYLMAMAAILILFLPHVGITINQLKIGGIAWLPPTDDEFLYRFFVHIFNDSEAAMYCAVAIPILALLARALSAKPLRKFLLALFFIIPYQVALYYNNNYSTVLQFSVLLFSVPFLMAVPASLFSKKSPWWLIHGISITIVLFSFLNLVSDKNFYAHRPFANFEGVAKNASELIEEYGAENMLHFSNSNNSDYFNYYYHSLKVDPNWEIPRFEKPEDLAKARDLIKSSQKEYLMLSFANVPIPPEVYEYAKDKYPESIAHFRYFNSDLLFLKKSNAEREKTFEAQLNVANSTNWSYAESQLDTSFYFSEPYSFHIKQEEPYALTYQNQLNNLIDSNHRALCISAQIYLAEGKNSKLVFSVENDSGAVYWRGIDIAPYRSKDDWFEFKYVFDWDYSFELNHPVKIYFWNPEKANFWVDNFKISNFTDADYSYYERRKL